MEGMSVAEHPASDFVVIVAEYNTTSGASEAPGVELLPPVSFEVLAFNTAVTSLAQGSIERVVVLLAVRRIVENVELGARERVLTGATHETLFVIAAG